MPHEFIDLSSPELGAELLKHAKDDLPIDVWRVYVLSYRPTSLKDYPAPVIEWCNEPFRSTLDPQQAVDEAWNLLTDLLFTERPRPYEELVNGIWDAQVLLFGAHSKGRRRGQPKSMQPLAVRAYIVRKFNPHPTKPGESTVSWAKLADLLFLENRRCPRRTRDEEGTKICCVSRHQYDSPCVKALMTAVRHLQSAMEHDGIPV